MTQRQPDSALRDALIRQVAAELADAYRVLDAYDRGEYAVPETGNALLQRIGAEHAARLSGA